MKAGGNAGVNTYEYGTKGRRQGWMMEAGMDDVGRTSQRKVELSNGGVDERE